MSVELIYKTTSPAALDWYSDLTRRDTEAREVVREFLTRINEVIPPWPGESNRDLVTFRDRPAGITFTPTEQVARRWGTRANLPEGWRIKREWSNTLVPALNTKAGKARQAELDALPWVSILSDMETRLGIPSMIMVPGHIYSPGFDVDRDDEGVATALWITWGSGRCEGDFLKEVSRHPADVEWIEVPRSEWYARVERLAAEKAEA